MPRKDGSLTPREAMWVGHMAATGDATYSAARAGYPRPPSDGWLKAQNPALMANVRKAQLARLTSDILPKALDLLERVVTDEKETTRNRLTAAQIVVKHSFAGDGAADDKEPHEMTAQELQARIDRLRRVQAERAKPVIDHEADEPGGGVFD